MPMNPNSDLVVGRWLGGITGLSESMVASILPQDFDSWAVAGFVTYQVIGGSPDLYLPVRKPVISVDTWAVNPSSSRPPWGKANYLAELIRTHVELGPRVSSFARLLTFTDKGDYRGANVRDAILRSEPRRAILQGLVPAGDVASFAHYVMELEIHWTVAV
jgi:hypothetical protein